jgi:hypothetical protein
MLNADIWPSAKTIQRYRQSDDYFCHNTLPVSSFFIGRWL